MNKKALLIALSSLSVAAAVSLVAFSHNDSTEIIKANGTVEHNTHFIYEDISEFLNDDGYCLAEVSKTTSAGNVFKSDSIIIQSYSEEPTKGDSTHDYLFKVAHDGYPWYVADSYPAFMIEFKMKVDVPFSVTKASLNYTVYYDEDSEDEIPATATTKTLDFVDYEEDPAGFVYDFYIDYTFVNQYQSHLTVNFIDINYSCSY